MAAKKGCGGKLDAAAECVCMTIPERIQRQDHWTVIGLFGRGKLQSLERRRHQYWSISSSSSGHSQLSLLSRVFVTIFTTGFVPVLALAPSPKATRSHIEDFTITETTASARFEQISTSRASIRSRSIMCA